MGDLRALLMGQPVSGGVRRYAFVGFALLVMLLEVAAGLPGDAGVLNLTWALAASACLALTGWLPATGGVLFGIVALVGILAPGDAVVATFPLIGVYAVAADWISRTWFVPAGFLLLAVQGVTAAASPNLAAVVVETVLGTVFAVTVGLSVRWNKDRVVTLRRQAEESRRAAEQARSTVQADLAGALQDTVTQDLIRIIVTSQSIARLSPDRQTAEEVDQLGDLARDAIRHLRALTGANGAAGGGTGGTGTAGSPEGDATDAAAALPGQTATESLGEVVGTCRAMLAGRGITLGTRVPATVESRMSPGQVTLAALAVREGATNIFSYGRTDSVAQLMVQTSGSPDAGDAVELTMVNDIDPAAQDAHRAMAGGYGLDNLSERVAAAGGAVRFGSSGSTWVLTVELPGEPRPRHPEPPAPGAPDSKAADFAAPDSTATDSPAPGSTALDSKSTGPAAPDSKSPIARARAHADARAGAHSPASGPDAHRGN